jgi:hypothetical protein
MSSFKPYQDRTIAFYSLAIIDVWRIKIYTISHQSTFTADATLQAAIQQLPDWLQIAEESNLPIYELGFLIVHEGVDGVWILLHWWTGGEMLGSRVYFANADAPDHIEPNAYPFGLVCVWELEVIQHEREAWMEQVLRKANAPDMEGYLRNIFKTHT